MYGSTSDGKAGETPVDPRRMIVGVIMNRVYLKEVLLFRGAARRGAGTDDKNSRLNQTPTKPTRIR